MARTAFLTSLMFCCVLSYVWAQQQDAELTSDASKSPGRASSRITDSFAGRRNVSRLSKSLARTLGEDSGKSKNRPAVHVNSSGTLGSYRSEVSRVPGAAHRLRAIRDAVILPGGAPQVKSIVPDAKIAPGTNSLRPSKVAPKSILAPAQSASQRPPVSTPNQDLTNASEGKFDERPGEKDAMDIGEGATSRRAKSGVSAGPVLQEPSRELPSTLRPGPPLTPRATQPSDADSSAEASLPSVMKQPSAASAGIGGPEASPWDSNESTPKADEFDASAGQGLQGLTEQHEDLNESKVSASEQRPTLAAPTLAAPALTDKSIVKDAEPVAELEGGADVPPVTAEASRWRGVELQEDNSISNPQEGEKPVAEVASLPTIVSKPMPSSNGSETNSSTQESPTYSAAMPENDQENTFRQEIKLAPTASAGPSLPRQRQTVAPPLQLGSSVPVSEGEARGFDPGPTKETSRSDEPSDKVLLSNRSPVLIVKTHGSRTIRVGRPASYFVTAANVGDLAANDVTVDISIPNWAEVTENQATSGIVRIQPSRDGDTVIKWSLQQLDTNARQRLRIDLIPRSSQPIELGVTWNFRSVSALAEIQVQEPKLQMSVVGPQDVQFGETKVYTITVSNPGTGDAENVVLTLLPINDGAGTAGVRELGTLAAGTRRSVEVELTARQAGEISVRAHAIGDGGLKTQGEQTILVRRANLEIEAVGPKKKYGGTNARFSIKVSNTGDATARDVVAVASLPTASKYVSSNGGGTLDPSKGKVRWSIGNLRPGGFQVVEVTAALMSGGKNRLDVRSTAASQLSAIASVTTNVELLPDLKLMVNDPPGAVAVGTEMTYEVRIINRGTKAAHDVHVVGYFSEGIEPVAVRGWRADVEVGQVVLEPIPRIAPGQEIVVKVGAQAQRPGDHVFRTELDSNDPETKLAVEEWTRFYGEEIATPHSSAPRQANAPGSLPPATLRR